MTRRFAATFALADVALDMVVGSAVPFQVATEFVTKLVPVRVRVRLAEPEVAVFGEMLVNVGPAMVKMVPVVKLPPGF